MRSPSPHVLTMGETMGLATNKDVGVLQNNTALSLTFGGAETNVAIGLARLGIAVTWVSRLGNDAIGRMIARELRAERVEVVAEIVDALPSGFMLKERKPNALSAVTYFRTGSAASSISRTDLPVELIKSATILHLSGITPALSTSARDVTMFALAEANAAGIPVSFDLNYRSKLWSRADAATCFQEILPLVDTVFAGVDEARLIVNASDPTDLAAGLRDAGARNAVIKDGANGCTAIIEGEVLHQDALQVAVVDSVGAGDAFVAGYLAAWSDGLPSDQRLTMAVTTGAFACTVPGDWEGAPRRADLRALGAVEIVTR